MLRETIHPRFSEMNPAGHIGYTVLPAWFEKGAERIYRIFMPDANPNSWSIIVAKLEMECLAEIHYGEEVVIESSVARIGNSSFVLAQTLIQNNQPAARAQTTMVHFDYAAKKAVRLDKEHREALSAFMQTDQSATG